MRRGAWSACRRSASDGPETEETAKTCTAPACSNATLAWPPAPHLYSGDCILVIWNGNTLNVVSASRVGRQPNAVEGSASFDVTISPCDFSCRDCRGQPEECRWSSGKP
jgi:hypothetical protein